MVEADKGSVRSANKLNDGKSMLTNCRKVLYSLHQEKNNNVLSKLHYRSTFYQSDCLYEHIIYKLLI